MKKSSADSTFLSASRLELPFLLHALADEPSFFHLPEHFRFLKEVIADHLRYAATPPASYLVVGGDAGADAYSLCLSLLASPHHGQFPYSILATEFLPEQNSRATKAIYPLSALKQEDQLRSRSYFLRSRNRMPVQIRLRPGVRKLVQFRCADIFSDFSLRERMNVIFCRHVLHHFHPDIAQLLAKKLRSHLCPGGLLFLGADTGSLPGFKQIGPAIYLNI